MPSAKRLPRPCLRSTNAFACLLFCLYPRAWPTKKNHQAEQGPASELSLSRCPPSISSRKQNASMEELPLLRYIALTPNPQPLNRTQAWRCFLSSVTSPPPPSAEPSLQTQQVKYKHNAPHPTRTSGPPYKSTPRTKLRLAPRHHPLALNVSHQRSACPLQRRSFHSCIHTLGRLWTHSCKRRRGCPYSIPTQLNL